VSKMNKPFPWILRSYDRRIFSAFDEFVVVTEGFRIKLKGSMLELSFVAASGSCSPDSAKVLADKYAKTLGNHSGMQLALETEEEQRVRMTPPSIIPMRSALHYLDCLSPDHIARAIRAARNELLASADEALRRCYDHIQGAREEMKKNIPGDDGVHVAAYKALEVLEEVGFGSEQKARNALPTLHVAKGAAGTGRHIPEKYDSELEAPGRVLDLVTKVIRTYEGYLLEKENKKKDRS
jgi:hypothetical protein